VSVLERRCKVPKNVATEWVKDTLVIQKRHKWTTTSECVCVRACVCVCVLVTSALQWSYRENSEWTDDLCETSHRLAYFIHCYCTACNQLPSPILCQHLYQTHLTSVTARPPAEFLRPFGRPMEFFGGYSAGRIFCGRFVANLFPADFRWIIGCVGKRNS